MAEIWVELVIFLIASLVLIKSASLAVKYTLHVAENLYLTPFVTSFILAALVSILPEFFVGVNSALEGVPEIGIGTLIGNNIVDLTVVMGIILILGRQLPIRRSERLSTLPFLIAIGLPLGLMLDGTLSQIDGLLLVVGCVIYFGWVLRSQPLRQMHSPLSWKHILPELGKFALAMVFIYFSSKFVVTSSLHLSELMNFPQIFAGLFLISFGAALPELTFSIQAVLSRHKSIALGDIMGNVALDATLSVGVMALIAPFSISLSIIGISAMFMVFAALLLTTFLDDKGALSRKDGIALLGLYVVFVVVQLTLHAAQGILSGSVPTH